MHESITIIVIFMQQYKQGSPCVNAGLGCKVLCFVFQVGVVDSMASLTVVPGTGYTQVSCTVCIATGLS